MLFLASVNVDSVNVKPRSPHWYIRILGSPLVSLLHYLGKGCPCALDAVNTQLFSVSRELEAFSPALLVCLGMASWLCSRGGAEGAFP